MPLSQAAMRRATILLAPILLAAAACPLAAQIDRAAADALRARVGDAVCTVTAENAWGVPVSVASGFALGDGRFVVTDLAAV
ncbi:MAG: hypothetical protein R6X20_04900, partial [Phycisphaerae bacterium]